MIRQKRTHGGTETTVNFKNGELLKVGRVQWLWKIGIGDDLVICGRLDTVPVAEEWVLDGADGRGW